MSEKENLIFSNEYKKDQYPSFVKITPLYSRQELLSLYSKISKIEEETYREEGRKRADDVLKENQEYQNLLKEYQERQKAETESTLRQIRKAVQEAWEGKLGPGEWVLVRSEIRNQFKKVIPLSEWERKELDKKKKEEEILTISEYYLLNPGNIEEKIKERQFWEAEDFDNKYLEVDISRVTNEEYQELFDKYAVKRRMFSLNEILKILPENFKPIVEAGTVFRYGGSSHHTGDIDGYLIALPSGRFAVVSVYEGENEDLFQKHRFWGILENPQTEPSWSAKFASWTGGKLAKPTQEEIDFLKQKKEFNENQLSLPPSASIEQGNKE